jgi:hypothetical protein
MYCVINSDNIIIALFLLESDAQDFVYCCRDPYSRKNYKVEYKEEYLYVKLD